MSASTSAKAPAATVAGRPPVEPAVIPPVRRRLPGNQALLRLQRQCSCGGSGTCAECENQRSGAAIQPKVVVGASNDEFEREAERVAGQVVSMSHLSGSATAPKHGGTARDDGAAIQRALDPDALDEDDDSVQRKPVAGEAANAPARSQGGLALSPASLGEGGDPLPDEVRQFFEQRFGRDFSTVRLHHGGTSELLNDQLHSYAFTFANHIWFGRGQRAGVTPLVAHELTHVVQQTNPPALDPAATLGTGGTTEVATGGITPAGHRRAAPPGTPPAAANHAAPSAGSASGMSPASPVSSPAAPAQGETTPPVTRPPAPREPIVHELPRVETGAAPAGPWIQRQDLPASSTVIRRDYGRGFFLVQTPAVGRATLRYRGQPWINVTWTPAEGRQLEAEHVEFDLQPDLATPRLTLRLRVPFRVQLQVLQSAEQMMADVSAASLADRPIEVAVNAERMTGSVTVFPPASPLTRTMSLPTTLLNRYTGDSLRVPVRIGEEGEFASTDPFRDTDAEPSAPQTSTRQVWIHDSQQAFEDFARRHSDGNWAGITLPDGRVVAYALTEQTLQRIAERVRDRDYRFDIQSDFPGSQVTGVFIYGRALASLNDLDNLYYSSEETAAAGIQGDSREAEIFSMGGRSFGRMPLTHAAALTRLAQLDAMTAAQIVALETEPGRPFEALLVQGVSLRVYPLDTGWFQDRDLVRGLPVSDPPWTIAANDTKMQVLEFEADRETPDPAIRQFLERNPPAAESLQREVVARAERTAQRILIDGMAQSLPQFRAVAESDADAALLIYNMASVSQQRRREVLQSLGVGEFFTPLGRILVGLPMGHGPVGPPAVEIERRELDRVEAIVASRANVERIIFGETIDGVNLQFFRDKARFTLTELEATIARLRAAESTAGTADKALYQGGPIGEEIRRRTYRELGFNRLRPEAYPHRDTQGWWPSALPAGAPAPLAEQLYANAIARANTIEDLQLLGKIVAAIVMILVSEGAGIVVAQLWFGGSVVAQTVAAALIFTALHTGFDALTGQSTIDPNNPAGAVGQFAVQAALNAAMFGFFRVPQRDVPVDGARRHQHGVSHPRGRHPARHRRLQGRAGPPHVGDGGDLPQYQLHAVHPHARPRARRARVATAGRRGGAVFGTARGGRVAKPGNLPGAAHLGARQRDRLAAPAGREPARRSPVAAGADQGDRAGSAAAQRAGRRLRRRVRSAVDTAARAGHPTPRLAAHPRIGDRSRSRIHRGAQRDRRRDRDAAPGAVHPADRHPSCRRSGDGRGGHRVLLHRHAAEPPGVHRPLRRCQRAGQRRRRDAGNGAGTRGDLPSDARRAAGRRRAARNARAADAATAAASAGRAHRARTARTARAGRAHRAPAGRARGARTASPASACRAAGAGRYRLPAAPHRRWRRRHRCPTSSRAVRRWLCAARRSASARGRSA